MGQFFLRRDSSQYKSLIIAIPLTVESSAVTLNETNDIITDDSNGFGRTWENLSVWGVNITSNISGINFAGNGNLPTDIIRSEYDNELNCSGLNYILSLQSTDSFSIWEALAEAGASALGIMAVTAELDLIPGGIYLSAAATSVDFALAFYDFLRSQGSEFSEGLQYNLQSNDGGLIYQNFSVGNGTFFGNYDGEN